MLGVSFNPEHQLNCEPLLQMTKPKRLLCFLLVIRKRQTYSVLRLHIEGFASHCLDYYSRLWYNGKFAII